LALVCNIDERGRAYRYRFGFVLVPLGVLVAVVASLLGAAKVGWLVGGVLVLSGAFSLFEANRGWCAVRAMGIKTKL
jgi:hypothetical protein